MSNKSLPGWLNTTSAPLKIQHLKSPTFVAAATLGWWLNSRHSASQKL